MSSDPNAAHFDGGRDDVFSRIAGRYDVLCDVFSLFIHRVWKRRMAQRICAEPWERMLDVAAGTGDIALRVARALDGEAAQRSCVVSDICPAMLAVAQKRADTLPLSFVTLDAHALDGVESASIDLYAMSFGMKICDRERAIAQAFRVLRPGGLFMCLEASEIPLRALHRAYLTYMNLCLPAIGFVATGGDRSAYGYLLKGIHDFPGAERFADEIASFGFVDVGFERLSLGIVAIHQARKP